MKPRAARGTLVLGTWQVACALGAGGVVRRKREGDGATPRGRWPVRALFYRPDRRLRPATALPVAALGRLDGWCDAPRTRRYNRPVDLPHDARCEAMWRDDTLYDLGLVLGYNDRPVASGAGSAIFVHVARPGLAPTEGCVALARDDLRRFIARLGRRAELVVG